MLCIYPANPSCVDDQLQHCVKLYKVLSEVKGEIEIVIKSGRKVCEDPSTKNPKKLNQRIDALKHLYNNLGETVTESKKQLEYLSKLTKELNDNFDLVNNYLHERQLNELSVELAAANGATALEQATGALSRCNEIFREYASVCDPNYLGDLKDRIEILSSRLERSARRTSDTEDLKVLLEMKSTLQNMNSITVATLSDMEAALERMQGNDPELTELRENVLVIVQVSDPRERIFHNELLIEECTIYTIIHIMMPHEPT